MTIAGSGGASVCECGRLRCAGCASVRDCLRVAGVHGPGGIRMFMDAGVRAGFRGG